MHIRAFQQGDEARLYEVFRSAIHLVASRDYSPEQINAWAPAVVDAELWAAKMQAISPFVVEDAGLIAGYADLQPSGYIDHFFVSGQHQKMGVGRLLMDHIHAAATKRGIALLSSDVSKTAQPFFERCGFHVVQHNQPVRRGVAIPNALMHKRLQDAN